MQNKKIVVIGGGTGTSVLLSGLKQYKDLKLTAIVNVSDSGGSTGRLRDEFGFLPIGDARQCLAALADGKYSQQLRDLLLYRFSKGEGLKGHNLGNLILTALEDLSSSPAMAIELASKLFRLRGKVRPITNKNVQLVLEYEDGTVMIGEHHLDNPKFGGKKIINIKLSPHAKIYQKARQDILDADLVVLGPGDLYASLLSNTIVEGFTESLRQSKAKFIYIANLMTHYSQTHNMTLIDHIIEIERYCSRKPDIIINNNKKISKDILNKYKNNQEFPVIDDIVKNNQYQVIRQNLISNNIIAQSLNDTVPRSLLRHDASKLAKLVYSLL